MSIFKKAERRQAKLKIAIAGPSGAGKTYSALLIASGLGGKIAVIDTENNSASLYADEFEFDCLALEAPFTTEKYLQAMNAAEKEGYNVVIIDSATHQWDGEGGINERKTAVDSRGGNSFTNWSKFTPEHNKFLSAIVQHDTHLICTVRSKQDYSLSQNDRGKITPQKIGLAPVQRQGFEYEFTVMFDVAMDHSAIASKDRSGLFDSRTFKIDKTTGEDLMRWLMSAKPKAIPLSQERIVLFKNIQSLQAALSLTNEDIQAEIYRNFHVGSAKELKVEQLVQFIEDLQAAYDAKTKPAQPSQVPENVEPSFADFQ